MRPCQPADVLAAGSEEPVQAQQWRYMFHVPCLSKTLPFLAAKFSTFLMEDGTLRRIIIKYNITVFLF